MLGLLEFSFYWSKELLQSRNGCSVILKSDFDWQRFLFLTLMSSDCYSIWQHYWNSPYSDEPFCWRINPYCLTRNSCCLVLNKYTRLQWKKGSFYCVINTHCFLQSPKPDRNKIELIITTLVHFCTVPTITSSQIDLFKMSCQMWKYQERRWTLEKQEVNSM